MTRFLIVCSVTSLAMLAGATASAEPDPRVRVGLAIDDTGDEDFGQLALAGAARAEEELHTKTYVEAEIDEQGRVRDLGYVVERLTQRQLDLVVAVGFQWEGVVPPAAAAHPATRFAIIDSLLPDQPNVLSILFREQEGSFLVGAAAALATRTHRAGFIGALPVPVIQRFEAGYVAGVTRAAADHLGVAVGVEIAYLDEFTAEGNCATPTCGFFEVAAAYAIAYAMYESGIDVIYHAAGGSGIGLMLAAADFRNDTGIPVWAIGVDGDQALEFPDSPVLTSMLKRVDVATFDVIAQVVSGAFQAGVRRLGLAEDGVGYSRTGGHLDQLGVVDELEDYRTAIEGGDIVVPEAP